MLSRFSLLVALCASAIVLLFPASANAWGHNEYCNIWNGSSSCITPWNNWIDHTVHNGSTNGGWIYCDSYHPDGSRAGAYGFVEPGHWRDFWVSGYNRMSCWYAGGPGGFPIAIYSYT